MTISIKKVSIILAVHNEAGNIPLVMQSIEKAGNSIPYNMEVIAVNDGSTDTSLHELQRAKEKYHFLKIVNNSRKTGMTALVSRALPEVSGDVVMFFPSDMESHPDEDIPKLLKPIENGYDVAAGVRVGRKDGKVKTSNFANFVISRMFRLKLHDMNWIKAMTRPAVDTLVLKYSWVRYMLLFPHFHGMKTAEVETNWYSRTYGRSKFGLVRILDAFKDLLILVYFYFKGDFHKKKIIP